MKPNLIEPGVKYIINKTFVKSKYIKEIYYNNLFNVIMFLILFGLVAILLFYKYKGKLTDHDIKIRNYKNKKYLLQKINEINYVKIKENKDKDLITDLPLFNKSPILSLYNN